jgi:hypothetical protein
MKKDMRYKRIGISLGDPDVVKAAPSEICQASHLQDLCQRVPRALLLRLVGRAHGLLERARVRERDVPEHLQQSLGEEEERKEKRNKK